MSDTARPSDTERQESSVTIGDVRGGVHDSIIAGRDVIIYEGIQPISIGTLLDACKFLVESALRAVGDKFVPELYVHRAIERDLGDFFDVPLGKSDPNCYLIVAPAGSGKTNLLCHLATRRVSRQPVLLLMGGNLYLGPGTGLLGTIQAELQLSDDRVAFRSAGDSLHTLHRLAQETDRDVLILLDAINEHQQPAQMKKAVQDLLHRISGRRIKLVVTCRDYYWGLFKGQFWKGATVNGLPTDTDDGDPESGGRVFSRFGSGEHERALELYLKHYGIVGRPVGDAVEQCRHPLLLRFFCEAYRGQDIGQVQDIRLKELFDFYWARKLDFIAERMVSDGVRIVPESLVSDLEDYLLAIAAYMLHHNVRAVSLADISRATGREERQGDPHTFYGRIRDEYIILEDKERGKAEHKTPQVAFVYEEFMEYVMARSLTRDWDRSGLDKAAILTEIEKLTAKYDEFAQILGVMVYLALMLREKRGLELWSLLLNKGERWQKVVLEAFRKLPEEQLDAGVFDALGKMLNIGDAAIQKMVLDALKLPRLGQASPASTVNVVCELAAHAEEAIRRRAVLALGKVSVAGVHLALPALARALHDPLKSVRDNAVTALVQLGGTEKSPLVAALGEEGGDAQRSCRRALQALVDSNAVGPLLAMFREGNRDVRRAAARLLAVLGDRRAVEPLACALRDGGWEVRRAAAQVLGDLGDLRAVDPLVFALRDDRQGVRQEATRALLKLGTTSVAPLIAVIRNGDADLRQEAAQSLIEIGEPGIESILALLSDGDRDAQQVAAQVLGELGDPRAAMPLVDALRDGYRDVRQAAAQALARLGEAAVEPLLAVLGNGDRDARRLAAQALGSLRDNRATEPLIAALGDERREVRRGAAQALGMLGDGRAMGPLIAALGDGYWGVRQEAAQALAGPGKAAVVPLTVAIGDERWRVRRAAAQALGEIGDPRAVGPLIAALEDDRRTVRQTAANALRAIGTPEALDAAGKYEEREAGA
jgi:HEAT repeat protein